MRNLSGSEIINVSGGMTGTAGFLLGTGVTLAATSAYQCLTSTQRGDIAIVAVPTLLIGGGFAVAATTVGLKGALLYGAGLTIGLPLAYGTLMVAILSNMPRLG